MSQVSRNTYWTACLWVDGCRWRPLETYAFSNNFHFSTREEAMEVVRREGGLEQGYELTRVEVVETVAESFRPVPF